LNRQDAKVAERKKREVKKEKFSGWTDL